MSPSYLHDSCTPTVNLDGSISEGEIPASKWENVADNGKRKKGKSNSQEEASVTNDQTPQHADPPVSLPDWRGQHQTTGGKGQQYSAPAAPVRQYRPPLHKAAMQASHLRLANQAVGSLVPAGSTISPLLAQAHKQSPWLAPQQGHPVSVPLQQHQQYQHHHQQVQQQQQPLPRPITHRENQAYSSYPATSKPACMLPIAKRSGVYG